MTRKMKPTSLLLLLVLLSASPSSSDCRLLPDWLVEKVTWPAEVVVGTSESSGLTELILTNGLLSRTFWLGNFADPDIPGIVTVDFRCHERRASLLRALDPEAVVTVDGARYPVGGVVDDPAAGSRAYLNRTGLRDRLRADPDAFGFVGYEVGPVRKRYEYRSRRGAPANVPWPPEGVHLKLKFRVKGVSVSVHYELYQGMPLMAKWVEAAAETSESKGARVGVNAVEILSLNQEWASPVVGGYGWMWVENDEPHGNRVSWETETPHDSGSFVPRLICAYGGSFSVSLREAGSFVSFRVLELVVGSADRERMGLARRRMLRTLAPQTSENPVYFHTIDANSTAFRKLVDELSEVGFEMVLYSFGSGWNLESNSSDFLPSLREDVRYANTKGIEVGGYDLIALTRRVPRRWAATDQEGEDSGNACFASGWYDHLLERVLEVIDYANISVLETDGPYGGYACHSYNHSHHQDAADSVYWQNRLQGDFFRKLREREIYVNQPDTYFYQGGSKTGMGYDESQYSLPRWEDLSVSRQGLFDDTFHYTPTVGWMFLPIEVYHGGGDRAKFEPLTGNIRAFEWGLTQYLGSGVAACYRGRRIFDSERTKEVVRKWVRFYKTYRSILTSDVVHVRRADMQDIDCVLHVDPFPSDGLRGLALIFNPSDASEVRQPLELPLYYTGLTRSADLEVTLDTQGQEEENGGSVVTRRFRARLDREFNVLLHIDLGPRQIGYVVIREPLDSEEEVSVVL